MARYQLTLAYDGTDFFGSQRQAKSRTVQGELEKALNKLGWTGRSVIMSGRTDTGVHATGQAASFDLDWSHADADLVRALNAVLPMDMAIQKAQMVHAKFHPRFDATSRCYEYKLFCQPLRDPIRERFAWRVWPAINSDALASTASLFLGTHDFSAFGSPTTPKGGTVRSVMKAKWTQTEKDEWLFEVQADAFLYRMVRRLVFVQVAVAQGKVSVERIAHALANQAKAESRSAIPSGLAPAHGLTLVEVTYHESIGQ
ncbi:MAG: tRNA pseudouridine(38-40) synthase TruA [Anaerolineae bacterium]|nr:tRNA pseudouridine(38-40) synthase TruA [Anaerolineae bacterium]MCI0608701.1 tRNA pseudouridine(38-40) synthase TruA [Anaerolineae bacterium]